ncbi:protein pollenless 3 [Quercus suber]|uniref:Protein pollenless 3 n=1 Tax=Quercus suber TaxID=58331 RepID=A0AAW0K8D8_QUESU
MLFHQLKRQCGTTTTRFFRRGVFYAAAGTEAEASDAYVREEESSPANESDPFHVIHKVPAGDSPYVRAKHVQLIDKDPSKAISLFWSAINAGDGLIVP